MKEMCPVSGEAVSYLPEEHVYKLVWNDEFNGDMLDETKWGFRTDFWGKHSPTFTKEGIVVSNGTLKINLIKEGDIFKSAHLQTGSLTFDAPRDTETFWPFGEKQKPKFMHRYGFYEICCKLPKNPGWHAAFWLQAPGIGTHPDPSQCGVEVDIMENYRQHTEGNLLCGAGWDGYGKECTWYGHIPFSYKETTDGWHRYAVDWSPDGYIFYADGKEVGRQMAPKCAVSNVDQFILVSTECHGYHRYFGGDADLKDDANLEGNSITQRLREDTWQGTAAEELKQAKLPDCFEVDFVRVFDRI